jgi:hypothetical protein
LYELGIYLRLGTQGSGDAFLCLCLGQTCRGDVPAVYGSAQIGASARHDAVAIEYDPSLKRAGLLCSEG